MSGPIYPNPKTDAQLRVALAGIQNTADGTHTDLGALEAVAVTADSVLGTDNVLVQTDGTARKVDATAIATADVVTEASAAGSSGLVMQSAGADKTVSATATTAANLVTASSAFTADNIIPRSDGATRLLQDSPLSISDDGVLLETVLSSVYDDMASFFTIQDASLSALFEMRVSDATTQTLAIGLFAGSALTAGSATSCVFIGTAAGRDNTSGDQNLFLGTSAGQKNTTGSGNTYIGTLAGQNKTTSGGNVGIGTNACATDGGASQVGIGSNALVASSGNFNVAVGQNAGNALTSGTSNTIIGRRAGATTTSQLATVTNSIAIGVDAYSTADNQIMVGITTNTQTILRGTVDVTRSTSGACRLNVYNTAAADPPGTSHELVCMKWSSDVAIIGTEKGSAGGAARVLALQTDGTVRITFGSSGTILLDTYANLPTSEPASGSPGTMWLQNDVLSSNSAFLMVTTS